MHRHARLTVAIGTGCFKRVVADVNSRRHSRDHACEDPVLSCSLSRNLNARWPVPEKFSSPSGPVRWMRYIARGTPSSDPSWPFSWRIPSRVRENTAAEGRPRLRAAPIQEEFHRCLINAPVCSSAIACRSCSCVFITMGPYQATGSSIGLPETNRKRIPSGPAWTEISSPRSNKTRE